MKPGLLSLYQIHPKYRVDLELIMIQIWCKKSITYAI